MQHISLFNGIGGFQLAARWMGWNNLASCEIDEFCNKVTKYHFPNCIQHGDIKTTDFSIYRGKCDILTGGFPCQPYSLAGKRKGKEDERHLWPNMLRAIKQISPRWVVGENVFGLINWNGGLVFNEVQTDLETAGYEVWSYVLPACGVNAPHRRDRIWFVAHAHDNGCNGTENRQSNRKGNDHNQAGQAAVEQPAGCCSEATGKAIANCYSESREKKIKPRREKYISERAETSSNNSPNGRIGIITNTNNFNWRSRTQRKDGKEINNGGTGWHSFPTQSPVCDGDDGLSTRLDGIAFSKWRNSSIKAAGNAIVPQVAYQIFKAIQEFET